MGDYQTVKHLSDIDLQGVTVDIVRANGSFASVTIRDSHGHELRLASEGGYGGLSVQVPKRPDPVTRYFVIGTRDGKEVEERFSEDYSAESRSKSLKALGADVHVEAREVVDPFDDRVQQ
jgi:hypothetical protein